MDKSRTKRLGAVAAALVLLLTACGGGEAGGPGGGGDDANVTTYKVAWLADFSGPYADVWPDVQKGREAVTSWWNDNVGADLGVRIEGKTYDHRYDPSQVASLWPGILSELSPVAALGVGGPDVAALQERLPDDQVPLLMSTAGYGYAWQADSWVFNPRATYAHEAAAFFQWYMEEKGLNELRVGAISSEASPAYVDMVKGMEKWADEAEGVEFVGVEYTDVQPSDLSTEVRRLLSKDADVIAVQTNTTMAVLAAKALKSQGAEDVPILVSSHNGLVASGRAAGDQCLFEGMYESYSAAIPAEKTGPAYEFYTELTENYGLDAPWDVPTVQGMEQGIFSLRVIEQAVKKVGAENLDGAAVREAAMTADIPQEETFGLLSALKFTPQAPFPTEGLTVNIGTIQDCKYAVAAENVPVPEISKW